jgi:hypothetical protein
MADARISQLNIPSSKLFSGPIKAIIGPKDEDQKNFRESMQKKENRKNMAVISQSVIEGGIVNEAKVYRTLKEFYPFYLSEHSNRISRRLHFVGTSIALVLLMTASLTSMAWLVAVAFVQGYAFAWVGHFFFEHNKPATFVYPWLSFLSDWRMWWDMLTGKIRF